MSAFAQACGRARRGEPLDGDDVGALAHASPTERAEAAAIARSIRDAQWGKTITWSPKVFLPLTNLCRDRCSYCTFRKDPGDPGAWTMHRDEVADRIDRGREAGCTEALMCLGDRPETVFASYRDLLSSWGHASTVDLIDAASRAALDRGMIPHTNAGILTRAEMARLRATNASLGLMLENISTRLRKPGMPHHDAPDKAPRVRVNMIRAAGELKIPFTTGILVGIGETAEERIESLIAIRDLHRPHRHIQECIVQGFAPKPDVPMASVPAPAVDDLLYAVALARLILDPEISVQAPPNLSAGWEDRLLDAGINDFGGISPVTIDHINPEAPWPHIDRLAAVCASRGFELAPRLPIYDAYLDRPGFIEDAVRDACLAARAARERDAVVQQ